MHKNEYVLKCKHKTEHIKLILRVCSLKNENSLTCKQKTAHTHFKKNVKV